MPVREWTNAQRALVLEKKIQGASSILRTFREGPVKNTLYMHHVYKPFKVFGQNDPLFTEGGWGKGGQMAHTGCLKTSLR